MGMEIIMPTWTVSINGTTRKYKTFEINRKVRMDSPPEFTAMIEYADDVDFNNVITFLRDDKVEWKGFVEDLEIDWDENGRYLLLGGRDVTLLLWRKYVENFNNPIPKTGGFFGTVSASELIQFLLRTPRSDLPINQKTDDDCVVQQYQFNKEGWGIDSSRFKSLDAHNTDTAYGDINTTILRKRNLYWSNSGSPFQGTVKVVDDVTSLGWETCDGSGCGGGHGISPYINLNTEASWIHSHTGINDVAEFTFEDLSSATAINSVVLVITWKPDTTWNPFINSDCHVQIWKNSIGGWCEIGDFGGRDPPWSNPWHIVEFDISSLIQIVDDINNIKVRFIETGSLSTSITYASLSISYAENGTQSTDDWVSMTFDDETITGIYFECRAHPDNYPRNYKITCSGAREDFSDYIEEDPNNHITLEDSNQTCDFGSYQDEIAYLYKDYGEGPLGDFEEYFSFEVDSSEPHPYAFIPWCLSNYLEDYKTLLNTPSHYFTAIEVGNSNNILTLNVAVQDVGGLRYAPSPPTILFNTRYFVKATRNGFGLRYQIFDNSLMRTEDLIKDTTLISNAGTFQYRFQAITYNGFEWSTEFAHTMDSIGTGGEQVTPNGDFESGSFLPYWAGGAYSIVGGGAQHSGNWCCKITAVDSDIYRTNDMNIDKLYVTSASMWHNSPIGSTFVIHLIFTDATYFDITVNGTGIWTEQDLLAYWADGKSLKNIEIEHNTAIMYIDDISVYEDSGWSTMGGDATYSTDTVDEIEGIGCEKIEATAGQKYYFEENITPMDEKRVDGWVRVPAPASEEINTDIHIPDDDTDVDFSDPHQWTGVNTSPWLNDDDDTNYILSDAVIQGSFGNYWWFENQIDSKYGSFIPNSNCRVYFKAKLFDGEGGHATTIPLGIRLWVQHLNDGTGEWTSDIGWADCTSTSYETGYFVIDSYLTTLDDWKNAKFKIDIGNIVGGGADKGGIIVTYAYLHMEGTGYMGEIFLMKLYNHDVIAGPDPDIDNCCAGVSVALDPTAISDQDKWRWNVYANGVYSSIPVHYNILSTEAVTSDTWYKLRLYTKKDSSAGYAKLYDITSGSEVELCECTGYLGFLDNSSYGQPDRYDFEARFGTYNSGIVYLDWTQVQERGPTHSTGYVYSGYGSDIILVNKTDNIYPDIIHSWGPRLMNNLKISITENDPNHGWEISQIYLYKTDPIKYLVVDGYMSDPTTKVSDFSTPIEEKFTFSAIDYIPCEDTDIGKQVFVVNFGSTVGELVSFDNDLREWRVATASEFIVSGFVINVDGGTGAGVLSADAVVCYAGGPYLTLGDEFNNFEYSTPIGPINIPKNRLFDVLWDLCITITDDYMPYEWWVGYDINNKFHIGSHRGTDKSITGTNTITFTTGVNMGSVKYAKSSRDTYQRCQVIGSGEGNTQVNTSSFWESDENAMDEIHGFIEDIFTQKQVTSPKIANRYAKVKLKLDASPKRKNAIRCIINYDTYVTFDYEDPTHSGAYDTYDVGDDVNLNDVFTGLGPSDNSQGSYRIWNIKKTVDNNGEIVTLTCQAPYLDIGNVWTQIWNELKRIGIVGSFAQDWAGEGTDTGLISTDKIATLFTATAKNEETDTSTPSDSPNWYTTPTPLHGAGWKSDSGNLSIYGGDSGGLGEMEVEAKYAAVYQDDGYTIVTTTPIPANAILVPADIPITQEPKFTGSFKIIEPIGTNFTFWNDNDFVEFGIFNRDANTGYKFRVVCHPAGTFILYAVYVNRSTPILKPICTVFSSDGITKNYKYKVEIITDYTKSSISTVTFNVYQETDSNGNPLDDPASTQLSAVFSNVDKSLVVRPIYVHAYGVGGANLRCIMNFYELKCERDII
jgi:hypothetical protein